MTYILDFNVGRSSSWHNHFTTKTAKWRQLNVTCELITQLCHTAVYLHVPKLSMNEPT